MDPGTAMLLAGGVGALANLAKPSDGWNKKQAEWLEKIGKERMAMLKPTKPLYETGAVPYMTDLAQRLVLGNLGTQLGGDILQKYGINLSDYMNVAGLNTPYSQNPEIQKYYPSYYNQQYPQAALDRLKERYDFREDFEPKRIKESRYA